MKPSFLVYSFENSLDLQRFKDRAIKAGYLEGFMIFSPSGTVTQRRNCLSFRKNMDMYNQAIIYGLSAYVPLPQTRRIKLSEIINLM